MSELMRPRRQDAKREPSHDARSLGSLVPNNEPSSCGAGVCVIGTDLVDVFFSHRLRGISHESHADGLSDTTPQGRIVVVVGVGELGIAGSSISMAEPG